MADSLEWYKRFPARWLTSEARMRMTAAERGIYTDLMDHQYIQGSLPNNHMVLARLASVPQDVFDAAWENIKTEFEERDGRLYQGFAEQVRSEAVDRRNKLRENGLLGGRPKKTKRLSKTKTIRLSEKKPDGHLRASTLLLSSSLKSKCSTEEKNNSARANGKPDFVAAFEALESQHPVGHNPKPQLAQQMVLSRCETADDCAAIVADHAGWLPAWRSGRSVPDLHNWVADWERGATPPKPQGDKRSRTEDTLAAWVAAAPEAE